MSSIPKLPTVKILTESKSRDQATKSGTRKVFFQQVEVECDQFRTRVDMDIDSPDVAHKIGERFEWDAIADLIPGQYSSVDLARRMTLRPLSAPVTK